MGARRFLIIAAVLATAFAASCGGSDDSAAATTPTSSSTSTEPTRAETTTTVPQPFEGHSLLVIGNSLTWDTVGGIHDGYLSIDIMTRQGSIKLDPNDYHINCSASLIETFENPSETCVDPRISETLTSRLSSPWDVVWLQPYPSPGSTIETDEQLIRDVVRRQPEAAILILTGWPPQSEYRAAWDQPNAADDGTPTALSRAYFDALTGRLSGIDVTVIPVGEVLYRLDERLGAGDVPGLDGIASLYRDAIHLNDLGQWVAGVTAAAVSLDADSSSFGKPAAPWYGQGAGFTPQFMKVAREVIEDVLH